MTTIEVTTHTKNIPLEKAWDIITDVEKFPQRVKYVKKVKVLGEGTGSEWYDLTTILWIPMWMRHKVTALKKNNEYGFIIPLSLGGYMEQKYSLSPKNEGSIIQALITFNLGNKFLNATVGVILENRLKNMLTFSFQKLGGEIIYN
jgi:ribosome-associated toxin RatA of RatAB toxin-antitoxin module